MTRIVAMGHCTVDQLGVVEHYPELDQKVDMYTWSMQGGGPAATGAATAARLGAEVAFVGLLGDDPYGEVARESLAELGVDVTALTIAPGALSPTSFVIVHRPTGRRSIVSSRGNLPALTGDDVNPAVLEGADVLLIDGHAPEAQRALAEAARARGTQVLLDAGSRREGMDALIAVSDVVVASERFSADFAGSPDRTLDGLLEAGPKWAVVTLGADGAVGRGPGGPQIIDGIEVEVVDTTGAGDVYHGAFAVALAEGKDLAECMHFAGAAASLSCRALGGRAGLPTADEVEACLREAG